MIEGVEKLFPLRKICDERGMVMHMLKRTDQRLNSGGVFFRVVIQAS